MTVRSLETIIRLATAHAKMRLSKSVQTDDVDVAIMLMNYCIFNEEIELEEEPEQKKE